MTLSQAFGILAASIAFVAILVAIGAAVAAAIGDIEDSDTDTNNTTKEK